MGVSRGPSPIVTDGLVFAVDAGNTRCYISGSTSCDDLINPSTTGSLMGASGGQTSPIYSSEGNGSWDFDGTDDAIVITNSGVVPTIFQGLGNNNDYSISCWIKTTTATGAGSYWYAPRTMIELRTETSSGTHCPFSFGLAGNKLWLGRTDDHITGADGVNGTTTINDGNWHYVVFTIDDDAWVLYVDGSSDASGTFSASTGDCSVGTTTSNFQIGARTTNTGAISSAFDGEIGLIMLYTKELTLTEIKQNYNSQKVRFGL